MKSLNILNRRRKGVYGPAMGKKLILAFDDLEVSSNNSTIPSTLELMRELLENQYWYDLEESNKIDIIDFVGIIKFYMSLRLDLNFVNIQLL